MTEPVERKIPNYSSKINRAIKLANSGKFSPAINILSKLVKEFDDAASAHGYLAWYLLQVKRYSEAKVHSFREITLAPLSEKASLIHFYVQWNSGNRIEALDEMKRFISLKPSQFYSDLIDKWKPDLEGD